MRIRCLLKGSKLIETQGLLKMGKESDSVEESVEMTTTERVSICLEAIVWIFEHIASRYSSQTLFRADTPKCLPLLEAADCMAKLVLELESERSLLGIRLDLYENLYLLAKEFNLVLCPSEYSSVSYKEKILREFILKTFFGSPIGETDFHAKQVEISRYD
jgi:hypothetical protein